MNEHLKIQSEVSSATNYYNVLLDTEFDIFVCNGQNAKMNPFEFKEKLFDIIVYWDNDMTSKVNTQTEKYNIKVTINQKEYNFVGNGLYPNNYKLFKNLLSELL